MFYSDIKANSAWPKLELGLSLAIFNGNTNEQRTVLQRFEQNMEKREKHKEESSHVILHSDPPSSILYEFGNG